jgi:phenylalanyl-tRNA synthetase alpha chain
VDLSDLTRDLEALRDDALTAIAAAPDVATLEALELDVLGKKGRLTTVLRGIGALPADDRPRVGAVANVVRAAIETALSVTVIMASVSGEKRCAGSPGTTISSLLAAATPSATSTSPKT